MLLIVLKKKMFQFFLMKRKKYNYHKLCALFLDVFCNFEQISSLKKKKTIAKKKIS